jgi:hypothetical protein
MINLLGVPTISALAGNAATVVVVALLVAICDWGMRNAASGHPLYDPCTLILYVIFMHLYSTTDSKKKYASLVAISLKILVVGYFSITLNSLSYVVGLLSSWAVYNLVDSISGKVSQLNSSDKEANKLLDIVGPIFEHLNQPQPRKRQAAVVSEDEDESDEEDIKKLI